MDDSTLSPLARSFRRHLRAENRAATTIETYLAGVRQAEDYLQGRGNELVTAERADLEAFIGDLLGRRAAPTAAPTACTDLFGWDSPPRSLSESLQNWLRLGCKTTCNAQ